MKTGKRARNVSPARLSQILALLSLPDKLSTRRVLRTLESQAGTYPRSSCRIRRFSIFINNLSRRFVYPRSQWPKWLLRCRHDTAVSLKVALFGHIVALRYVLLSRSNFSSNFSDLWNVGSKVLPKYKSRRECCSLEQPILRMRPLSSLIVLACLRTSVIGAHAPSRVRVLFS